MTTRFIGDHFEVGDEVVTGNGGIGRVLELRTWEQLPYDGRGDVWWKCAYLVEVNGHKELWPWNYLEPFNLLDELASLRE